MVAARNDSQMNYFTNFKAGKVHKKGMNVLMITGQSGNPKNL